uniref:Gb3_synth domain-containing protein n=1 Tax=Glossina austeni TaxID=7395 RepID=A0A1A9VX82_GLOAU
MDFDTITLKSREKLPLNYTGIERGQDGKCKIGAGVLNLAYNALGEQVANLWLNMFNITQSNTLWGASSVETVTNAIRKLCGDRNNALGLDSERVCGFHFFNYTYFYAIDWWNWKTFFRVSDTEETLNKLKYSYVAHLWSAHSRNSKGCKNYAYNILIKRHCPNTFFLPVVLYVPSIAFNQGKTLCKSFSLYINKQLRRLLILSVTGINVHVQGCRSYGCLGSIGDVFQTASDGGRLIFAGLSSVNELIHISSTSKNEEKQWGICQSTQRTKSPPARIDIINKNPKNKAVIAKSERTQNSENRLQRALASRLTSSRRTTIN